MADRRSTRARWLRAVLALAVLLATLPTTFQVPATPAEAAAFPTGGPNNSGDRGVPLWSSGVQANGPIHYAPVAWPSESAWQAYKFEKANVNDPRTQDPSNGGARPQNYVNISSGYPDQSKPSMYTYYDATNQVLMLRQRS